MGEFFDKDIIGKGERGAERIGKEEAIDMAACIATIIYKALEAMGYDKDAAYNTALNSIITIATLGEDKEQYGLREEQWKQ